MAKTTKRSAFGKAETVRSVPARTPKTPNAGDVRIGKLIDSFHPKKGK